jgi:serine/threonine-protein kinase
MEEAPTILDSRVIALSDATSEQTPLHLVESFDLDESETVVSEPVPRAVSSEEALTDQDVVLRREERIRARGCAWIMTGVCAAGVIGLPLHMDPNPFMAFGLAVLLTLLFTSLWVIHRTRSPEGYTMRVYRFFGWTAALCSVPIQYVLGVFSPVPAVITLGISIFGGGTDRRHALLISAVAISGYFVCAMGVVLGVLPDLGLFPASAIPFSVQLFSAVTLPAFFCMTLWMARLSRHSMLDAIERSREAFRLAARREAQLYEAKQHLERALKASGAGRSGRFSGLMVGEYELDEVIGRGAMAEVYRGRHLDTGAAAAVKLMHASVASDPHALSRFEREGALAGRPYMPNVVQVYEAARTSDATPFIAMELLEGRDLAAILRDRGPLSVEEGILLARQVGLGLSSLHDVGILHRDIKPQNLFCRSEQGSTEPRWTILDFGVCRFENSDGTLTDRGVIGTPGYLAPEQTQGDETTPASDVFSFGAVLYRALTGQPPFSGKNFPEVIFAVAFREPTPPSVVYPELPEALDGVLLKALHKDPKERHASPLDLVRELENALT